MENICFCHSQHFYTFTIPFYTVPFQLHFICVGTGDHFIKNGITEDGFQGQSEYNTWFSRKKKGGGQEQSVSVLPMHHQGETSTLYPWVKAGRVGNTADKSSQQTNSFNTISTKDLRESGLLAIAFVINPGYQNNIDFSLFTHWS